MQHIINLSLGIDEGIMKDVPINPNSPVYRSQSPPVKNMRPVDP